MAGLSDQIAVLAGAWGVLMAIAPLLQIRAIVRRGDSAGVSAGHIAVLCVGFVLWLTYGLSIASTPLIVTNVVAITTGIATLAVIVRYRRTPDMRAVTRKAGS
ncbi:MAG: SemiSWEET family transporter [Actinomycetota bacterium]